MKKELSILLTIGVPTYNRGHILDVFFDKLLLLIQSFGSKLEVIVSDNCSNDNTSEVCGKRILEFNNLTSFIYHRHESNIGAAKNILSIIERCHGEFFMFLGDDDFVDFLGLQKILKILENNNKPSAIIQGVWAHKKTDIKGYVNYHNASKLFYEYGNSWAAIIDSNEAKKVLNDNNFRSKIENNVWVQTAVGFIVIGNLKKDIYVTDFAYGGYLSECQNINNKSYFTKSLEGLLKVSIIVDNKLSANWIRKTFVNDLSIGFVSRLNLIVQHSFINNTSSIGLQRLLNNNFGLTGFLISKALLITDKFPVVMKYIYIIIFSILKLKNPFFIYKKLNNDKVAYFNDVKNISITKKKFGDTF
jgi:glycosyltransferase involved in cell wall biosynthesis